MALACVLTACLTWAPSVSPAEVPAPLQGVGFAQHLDRPLPLALPFQGADGAPVRLGRYFDDRPVVLVLGYYGCRTLCSTLLGRTRDALAATGLAPGADYRVVAVSIDPGEGPADARLRARAVLGEARGGWQLLTGDAASIRALADTVGFGYRPDPETGQYAHPAGILVATPNGRVSRYLLGLEYPPRDLRLALVTAGEGRIGNAVDQLLLACYRYDPATGRYSLLVTELLRWAGGGMVLALGGAVVFLRRRER